MTRPILVVDFETHAIEDRPAYPPKPVGVALRHPSGKREYWAWGHPDGNNTEREIAQRALGEFWRSHDLLFHNAAFDLEVAHVHLGLPYPAWDRYHDTLFLAFLKDPNAESLSLKDLGRKLLKREPKPQARLEQWIIQHLELRAKKTWGAYIAFAPAQRVAPYAKEDVELTWQLFRHLYRVSPAYDRERKLLPILLRMSREGIPINESQLAQSIDHAQADLERVELWLRRRLKQPGLDCADTERFADSMESAGLVRGGPRKGYEWLVTEKTEKRSLAIPALREVCLDPDFVDVMEFRSLLGNQLRTFARPWAAMGGKVHCSWHQVRHHNEQRQLGARTGRISSSPNLQNVPNELHPVRRTRKGEGLYVPIDGVRLMDLRAIVEAPKGMRIADADYSQQELRVLAHFVGGAIAQAYRDDPHLDMHIFAQRLINEKTGLGISRVDTKRVGFGVLYGMGLEALASRIHTTEETARIVRRAYKQQLGIEQHERDLRKQAGCMTWGGRWCPVEPATLVDGEIRDWSYKILNTEIQGSSADITKEAMVRYEVVRKEGRMLLTVHDELVIIAPTRAVTQELKLLRAAMESVELKVPLTTDGKVGTTWRVAH